MSAIRSTLALPRYRGFVAGAFVGAVGAWMLRTAQLVLVVEITHGDGLLVGITTAAQYVPILAFSAHVGVAADRFAKMRLLLLGQLVMLVTSLAQMALLLGGQRSWAAATALAFGFGIGAAIDGPMRAAVVPELVPAPAVPGAVGVNVVIVQLGRLIGPAISAVLIGAGSYALSFGVAAAFIVAFVVILPRLVTPPDPAVAGGRPGGAADGFRYLRTRPRILVVFALVGVGGVVGPNLITLSALTVNRVFAGSATQIGFASTALAIGGVTGAIWASQTRRSSVAVLCVLVAGVGVTSAVSSLMPTLPLYLLALVAAGGCALAMVSRGTSIVQHLVDDDVRGRVTGLYYIVLTIGAPIGSPLIGAFANLVGIRIAVLVAGLVVLACAVGLAVVERRTRRFRIEPGPTSSTGPVE